MKKTGVIVAIVIALVLGCGILFVTCNSNKGPDFNSLEGTYYLYTVDGYNENYRIVLKDGKFTIYYDTILGVMHESGTYQKLGEGTYAGITGLKIAIHIYDEAYSGIMSNGKIYHGATYHNNVEDNAFFCKKGAEKQLKHWGVYYRWSAENGYDTINYIVLARYSETHVYKSSEFEYGNKPRYEIDGKTIVFRGYGNEIVGTFENDTIIISDDEIYKKSPYV